MLDTPEDIQRQIDKFTARLNDEDDPDMRQVIEQKLAALRAQTAPPSSTSQQQQAESGWQCPPNPIPAWWSRSPWRWPARCCGRFSPRLA